jgi:hypothetical protein
MARERAGRTIRCLAVEGSDPELAEGWTPPPASNPQNVLSVYREVLWSVRSHHHSDHVTLIVTLLARAERQQPHRTRERYLLDLFPVPSRDGCAQRHHRALFGVG